MCEATIAACDAICAHLSALPHSISPVQCPLKHSARYPGRAAVTVTLCYRAAVTTVTAAY